MDWTEALPARTLGELAADGSVDSWVVRAVLHQPSTSRTKRAWARSCMVTERVSTRGVESFGFPRGPSIAPQVARCDIPDEDGIDGMVGS